MKQLMKVNQFIVFKVETIIENERSFKKQENNLLFFLMSCRQQRGTKDSTGTVKVHVN